MIFGKHRNHFFRRDLMNRLLARREALAAFGLLLAGCALWALWPVLNAMADRWSRDPRYAHGYLVPVFSVVLLRMRYGRIAGGELRPSTWGLALIALGAVFQLAGGYYRINSVEGLALPLYLGGAAALVGGWRALDWAWPAIAFLIFMLPLPWGVETALGPPLQSIATASSTYLLQTLGFMAFAEGNVIHLNEARIGVVEACSGLSMLISFIALSTAAALVVRRPLLDRMVLVSSAVPVALAANIVRITMTAIFHDRFGGHVASTFYHDIAGWIMIPIALLLYWLEIWILSHLLIERDHGSTKVLGAMRSPGPVKKGPLVTQHYKPSAL
jgi:exosortase